MTTTPDLELRDDERTPCEVWTRVMGYHRPTTSFNAGKRSEHQERRYFREPGLDHSPGAAPMIPAASR